MLANKYVVYAVLALIAIGVGTTYIVMWKASIKHEALLQFNNTQLEQVIEEQKKLNSNLKALGESSKVILDTMNTKNEELTTKLGGLEEYFKEEETKPSVGSSDVLKRTIRELGGK